MKGRLASAQRSFSGEGHFAFSQNGSERKQPLGIKNPLPGDFKHFKGITGADGICRHVQSHSSEYPIAATDRNPFSGGFRGSANASMSLA